MNKDVAKLYGVETREINQAVKNNPNKFPTGYTYSLTNQEVAEMRSKFLTTSSESTLELNFFIGKLKHTVKRTKKDSNNE